MTDFIPNDELRESTLKDWLSWYEKELITDALRQSGGNISKARRMLGVPRSSMQLKIKRFGINAQDYKKKTCRICDKVNFGFPELVAGGDSFNKPLVCHVCGAVHDSDGKLKGEVKTITKDTGDTGEGENPGAYRAVSRGFGGVRKGTPGKPRVV